MARKLTPVDVFYIEHHKDKLTVEAIAKQIGCTSRTIYNYINKSKGDARTEEGRELQKGNTPAVVTPGEAPPPKTEYVPSHDLPPAGDFSMDMLGRHKRNDSSSSAVVMTKEASEVGDEIAKRGSTKVPDYLHIINKDKE